VGRGIDYQKLVTAQRYYEYAGYTHIELPWTVDEEGYELVQYPAAWEDLTTPGAVIKTRRDGKQYNAKAGLDRNLLMAQNADAAIIFWDGKSTGSKNMIDIAKRLGLLVRVVKY
jgi:hypothetical protein